MLAKQVLYCLSYTSSPFALVILEMRSYEPFAWAGLKPKMKLLISSSQVARITDVSYQGLANSSHLNNAEKERLEKCWVWAWEDGWCRYPNRSGAVCIQGKCRERVSMAGGPRQSSQEAEEHILSNTQGRESADCILFNMRTA
jgi:hypothetical protein